MGVGVWWDLTSWFAGGTFRLSPHVPFPLVVHVWGHNLVHNNMFGTYFEEGLRNE